jgi:glycosyltransferase involved in cell wall biosynthesis
VVYPAVSVPMGVKQDKFDRFTFIFVGGDAQYAKGVIQVIRAFRELKETYDCDLIVVSSGVTELQTLFDPIDGIKYFAPMPREDLMRMIGKSHCMLLPSVGDTFGMVLLEAKARKIPAIVYDSFSAKEIIEDGKTGLVIAPDYNLNLWFDEDGIKRFNKGAFHSQFIGGRFNPSNFGTGELLIAMKYMVDNTSNTKKMGIAGFKDVESGKFSIGERNRGLKDVYGGGSK